jgi:tripeptidyl-peptidase-1
MEQLLKTKYYFYEHANGGRKHISCEDYKIPAAVSQHIDYVTPGVKLLATRALGDMKIKRSSASLNSHPLRKEMPADVLARIKANPGMVLFLNGLGLSADFANSCH